MAVDANKYFRGLRAYLNTNTYEVTKRDGGRILLEEKIFMQGGAERKQKVRLGYSGEVIVIQLDKKNQRGNSDPLFHFFDDDARPWSKRCDYVVFQLLDRKITVYCIEFKSASLPESLVDQLSSSEAWCKAVHSIINLYTGEKKRLNLKKFVFSCMDDPSRFVDQEGYLNRDHSIKHYHYDDLNNMSVEELENECPVLVG
ncbi:hypothetical protein [Methylophaga thalassica]|uniref:hypothetical protein n=1 Tax=Methylophaga thalassica TaxID=40223 RepID=UPI002E7C2129|nr:hypothetical protein [Methylophaga thalassica]WVI84916.1 hypothetical protein VSX76_14195 [Methylophaga thalassica]